MCRSHEFTSENTYEKLNIYNFELHFDLTNARAHGSLKRHTIAVAVNGVYGILHIQACDRLRQPFARLSIFSHIRWRLYHLYLQYFRQILLLKFQVRRTTRRRKKNTPHACAAMIMNRKIREKNFFENGLWTTSVEQLTQETLLTFNWLCFFFQKEI